MALHLLRRGVGTNVIPKLSSARVYHVMSTMNNKINSKSNCTGKPQPQSQSQPQPQEGEILQHHFPCSLFASRNFGFHELDTPIECARHAIDIHNKNEKALAGLRRINLDGLRWRVFDAKDQVLGRLAAQISTVIQGKDKPTYAPNRDDGDMCIVLNAKDISVTGRKLTDKIYYWHTGYVGHLKERTLKDQMAKDPTDVIRKAVLRMLPRNKLRDDRDRKLRIFNDSEHPFSDRPLEPYIMPPRTVREMRPRARRAVVRAQKKIEEQEKGGKDSRKGRKNKEVETNMSAA